MAAGQMSEVLQRLRSEILLRDGADLTDGQLLEDYTSRGNQESLAILVHRHGPMVWGVCRRVLRNQHDAEDAFQATFLVLVRKASAIVPCELLANWLYGAAHQTALNARATIARRCARERQVTVMPEPVVVEQDHWNDLETLLDQELSRLPEKYRVPIILCDLEGKTRKEAAEQLGCPEGTVAGRLARARVMLARRLARYGLAVSGGTLAALFSQNLASAGVPASVVSSTINATTLLAAGQAVALAVLSPTAASLVEGVLKTMLLNKLRTATALVLVLLAFAGGALAFLPGTAGQSEARKDEKRTAGRNDAREKASPGKAGFPDLTKIDRTIVKEPKYKTEPYYALLVFGPEAKKRVWLVVDGETLYVDRNGNGDLTEAKERIAGPKNVKIGNPGLYKWMNSFDIGEVEGLRLRLYFWVRDKKFVPDNDFDEKTRKVHEEHGWEFATLSRVKRDGSNILQASMGIPVTFCRWPQDAQICHLAGPLTLFPKVKGDDRPFVRGEDNWFQIHIGTPGLPPRYRTDPVYAQVATSEVPADVHPVAHFEFPHKDVKQPPIKRRVVLDQRCCGDTFYGPVQVPPEAGSAKVKVRLSFPAWKGGTVAPATFEVPITEKAPPQPRPKKLQRPTPSWLGRTMPDRLPLGIVRVGATIEASFFVCTKSDDPKNGIISVEAPAFVKVVDKSLNQQNIWDGTGWVKGVASTVVIRIDTSKAGPFKGEVDVKLGTNLVKVPVSAVVKPREPAATKLLVVASPFQAFSTDDASLFKDWTDMVEEAKWDMSNLILTRGKAVFRALDLSKFDVILLGADGLLECDADDIKRARAFVERGGRLVLAANAFYRASVPAANKILNGYGLKMLDEEAPIEKNEAILDKRSFAPEIVEAGIRSVRFHRASPVVVTDAKRERVLVKAVEVGEPKDGFVAVAKAGKGEVVALGQSLWWSWISAETSKGLDNAKLFRLLLKKPIKKN
jgi:RNA polymerase sigma factor (sigma-70 family)